MTDVGTFCGDILYMFSEPLSFYVSAPIGTCRINFERVGPPIWSQSEQIWKSGNCDSVQEGALQSIDGLSFP